MESLLPLTTLTSTAAFVVLYLLLFVTAKWLKDVLTPYSLNDELSQKDNLAIAVTMAGYYLGTLLIFVATLKGPSQGLQTDLFTVGGYALAGLLCLNFSRWFNDKLILRKFCDVQQLTQEHNIGVAMVHFAGYVATGCVAAGALSGQGGWLTFVVFFVLGQMALLLFSLLYNLLSAYDIHEALEQHNHAAGLAFAGHLVALGIIVMNSSAGDFRDWETDLTSFALSSLAAFILLPVLSRVMDKLIIAKQSLGQQIQEQQNMSAGLLEAVMAISFAIVISQLI